MDEGKRGNPWVPAAVLTLVCLGVLGGGGTYIVMAARPARVTAVPSLKPYTAKDKSFGCVSPEGWKLNDGAGGSTQAFATWTKGGARLQVSTDLAGSLMGDISKSPMAGMGGLDSMPGAGDLGKISKEMNKPPVEKLHETGVDDVENLLLKRGYEKYEDGKMQAYQGKAGDSRISEFTADGGMFGGKIHGFRTTSLGTERRVRVIAYALEEDWKLLKRVYQQVIMSVEPGNAQ